MSCVRCKEHNSLWELKNNLTKRTCTLSEKGKEEKKINIYWQSFQACPLPKIVRQRSTEIATPQYPTNESNTYHHVWPIYVPKIAILIQIIAFNSQYIQVCHITQWWKSCFSSFQVADSPAPRNSTKTEHKTNSLPFEIISSCYKIGGFNSQVR